MNKISPYINIHTHRNVENQISIECVGVHPYRAEDGTKLSLGSILPSTEAVGEIGLDFSRPISREKQENLFKEQLLIAEQFKLPVVIHSVRAMDRTFEILKGFSLPAVIFHGFIGSEHQAKEAVKRDYFLSFGHRCFASPKTLSALRSTPLVNIFFETDEADISIEEIYLQAAKYRTENLDEIKDQIYKNYTKIFKK